MAGSMAIGAYDPCFSCATHAFAMRRAAKIEIYDHNRRLLDLIAH